MSRVLVLGGGPAGAAASLLLASWGHPVRLITRPAVGSRLAVSLPPSCGKLFEAIGVSAAIDAAGFVRSTGNTVWWGEREPRVEMFAAVTRGLGRRSLGEGGWQVELNALETAILAEAERAGVAIERRLVTDDDLQLGGGFVLDCSGRSGVLARAMKLRRFDEGPRTIALAAEWRRQTPWPVPDDSHTLVESYQDGWVWSVPTAAGCRHVAAMVDPQRSGLARGGSARDIYLAEIAKTREFTRILDGASIADGPSGWDASTYRALEYAGDGWLLVGDAGSFIDPLSSAGVKKALASAWLAAVVTRTCLETPAMRSAALSFFSAREREIERHHAAESRRFLSAAARAHHDAFWNERSADPEEGAGDADAVRRAFDELKAADGLRVSMPPGIRIEPRPCVRGHAIVLEPHVIPREGPAVRYLRDVDVLALLELAPAARQVPELFDAYVRKLGRTALPDFLFALATTVARGWLVREWPQK